MCDLRFSAHFVQQEGQKTWAILPTFVSPYLNPVYTAGYKLPVFFFSLSSTSWLVFIAVDLLSHFANTQRIKYKSSQCKAFTPGQTKDVHQTRSSDRCCRRELGAASPLCMGDVSSCTRANENQSNKYKTLQTIFHRCLGIALLITLQI